MLTITQTAAEAIDAIVASADVPEDAGLRIAHGVGADGQGAFAVTLTDAPEAGDQVLERDGAPVFLESDAAPLLDDKVLDARVEGERVGFVLAEQD